MIPNFAARIRALEDERLEAFVKDWLDRRTRDYVETQRWSGPGDMGRDVVGYATPHRHEGDWDNFQCKQLSARLSEKDAFVELGKIFMHAAAGDYSLPRSYTFVAPKGVVRNVQNYVAHSNRFCQAFLDKWDAMIASELVENQTVPLSPGNPRRHRAFRLRARLLARWHLAAAAEARKIEREQRDLARTVASLTAESNGLRTAIGDLDRSLLTIEQKIAKARPKEAAARNDYEGFFSKKSDLEKITSLLARRDALTVKKSQVEEKPPNPKQEDKMPVGIDGPTAYTFGKTVREILEIWRFPRCDGGAV